MEFPKVKDIATKEVVRIDQNDNVGSAVAKMYQSNHRDVVVHDSSKNSFGILKVNDLIRMKLSNVDFATKISHIKYDPIAVVHEEESVLKAMELIDKKSNCLCVVDDENRLCGYLSYYDIISTIDPKSMLQKRTLGDVLLKSRLKFADENESAMDVMAMMEEDIDDCIILHDKTRTPSGIITTKDVVKLFGRGSDLTRPVKEYMNSPIETVGMDVSISDALNFIKKRSFKRLIVTGADGEIIGQISQEELIVKVYSRWAQQLKSSASQLKEINKVLTNRARRFEAMAVTDHLTGVYNRSKFENEVKIEIDKLTRYGLEPFSILLFDVDDFKTINDVHGHMVGDTVLQKLSKLVKNSLRSSDIVARWGGEEFVAMLPFTSGDNAYKAAEVLTRTIAQSRLCEEVPSLTVSMGVTTYREGDSVFTLLRRADEGMYRAKKTGKNRVVAK